MAAALLWEYYSKHMAQVYQNILLSSYTLLTGNFDGNERKF